MNFFTNSLDRLWASLALPYKIAASFVFCTLLSLISFVTLQMYVASIAPGSNTSFEKLRAVTGVFDCCGKVTNYPATTVGDILISCAEPSYTGPPPRGKLDDFTKYCNLPNLNGSLVTVEQVRIGGFAYVTQIVSQNHIYFYRSNTQLREQWISNSRIGNLLLCILFPGVLLVILIIQIFNKE